MLDVKIRKLFVSVEEIYHEGGAVAVEAKKRGVVLAVIKNPYAGAYHEDIQPFMENLKPLGLELASKLLDSLGGDPRSIQGYGKGSIVGEAGELEHAALWHAPGGYAMREVLGGAKAIVPSTKKVGGLGTRLDIPITHINASYVRSHLDAIEVGIADAPKSNEMVVALVMTTGPRVHARTGGLNALEIKGHDGLR